MWEQSEFLQSLFPFHVWHAIFHVSNIFYVSTFQGEPGPDGGSVGYGFAFVDCATLRIWIGSIPDDASCAALGALLVQVKSSCLNALSNPFSRYIF